MPNFYPYQLSDIKFLTSLTSTGRKNKILATAPGTGKTVTICGGLKAIQAKSAVIVCPAPTIVKQAWRHHLIEWGVCTDDDIFIVKTGKDEIPTNKRFIIVNFELLQNKDIFRSLYWGGRYDAVVIDEAQRLKAVDSKTSLRILGGGSESLISRGEWKWLASGSMMPNRPAELFPAVSSLSPEIIAPFGKWQAYIEEFCGAYKDKFGWHHTGASNIEDLAKRLFSNNFMRRRELEDVYKELPEVIERHVYVDLGDMDCDETNTQSATLRKAIGVAKLPYIIEYLEDCLSHE